MYLKRSAEFENGFIVEVNELLTAKLKRKGVSRIRTTMCTICVRISNRKATWDKFFCAFRPFARIMNQGAAIIHYDSLPSKGGIVSNRHDCVVYCCLVQVTDSDVVWAVR